MPICPHCQTTTEEELVPCPAGDGYYTVQDKDYSSFQGDKLLGLPISGRYIITSVIGRGAIGRVYKGRQLGVDRDVVLKLFRLDNLLEEELGYHPSKTVVEAREDARERFIREAKVLGQLTHPNCVTLYDFGISDDDALLYIAMEFVAGNSLRRALKRGLRPAATIDVMRQILAAVRQAHSLDIVHRDLKPENIILSFRKESGEPVVKVLDFGIAKLVGKDQESYDDAAKTSVGMLFGTPAYMSPEQCRGAVSEIGLSSDVYAIGCLFFELVTGHLPFPGRSPQQMILMHQEQPVPSIVPRDGMSLPNGLDAFIKKCLAKSPEDRYPSAKEALRMLDSLVEGWVPPPDKKDVLEPSHEAEVEALRQESREAQGLPRNAGDVAEISATSPAMHTARGETFDNLPLPLEDEPLPGPTNNQTLSGPVKQANARASRAQRRNALGLFAVLIIVTFACIGLVYFLYANL